MPSRDIDTTTRIARLPQTGHFMYASYFYSTPGRASLSNTLYYIGSGPPGSGFNPDTLAASLCSHLDTAAAGVLSNLCEIEGCRLVVHSDAQTWSGVHLEATVGAISSPPLPNEVAVVVRRQTSTPGKSGRGRMYWRGVPLTFVAADRLDSTAIGAFLTLTTALGSSFVDQTITWTPAHFARKPVPPATLGTMIAATSWTTDGNVGTARRSRPRF